MRKRKNMKPNNVVIIKLKKTIERFINIDKLKYIIKRT